MMLDTDQSTVQPTGANIKVPLPGCMAPRQPYPRSRQ